MACSGDNDSYTNISVEKAANMIKKTNKYPNLVILDVRTDEEYDRSHIFGAINIPFDEIEERIEEIEGHLDDEIIVYCKAGSRSEKACKILNINEFSKIFNLIGGIESWTEKGHMIWTLGHHIDINLQESSKISIKPLIPIVLNNTCDCGCPDNNSSGSDIYDINSTLIEETDDKIITLTVYTINNIIYKVITTYTLIWSYNESNDNSMKSAYFISKEYSYNDHYIKTYNLIYMVHSKSYNLTISTILVPINSELFNASFTYVILTTDKDVITLEEVDFGKSVVILSQLFSVLAKVAKKISQKYYKYFQISGEENFSFLAKNYQIMKNELNILSNLIKLNLFSFNFQILHNRAFLIDPCNDPIQLFICGLACRIGCYGTTGYICFLACAGPCAATWGWGCPVCVIACAIIVGLVCEVINIYGCIPGCDWIVCQI